MTDAVPVDDLAALIRRVMDERDWTITTIARRSHLPTSTVHSWKNGDRATGSRGPSPDKLRQLAAGLGLTPAEVFEAAGRRVPATLPPDEERRFFHLLRAIAPEDRKVIEATMEAMLSRKPS